MPHKIKLVEFIDRKRAESSIEVELPDGSNVVIPPAELWPDEVAEAFKADDRPRAGRAILGEEAYDRFVKAGGNWKLLNAMIMEMYGGSVGESSASATS